MTSRVQHEIDGLAILQEWEGYVLEVVGDRFVARLIDVYTGYGLTQVLPIIVAALSSAPGGLLLIENPEVHLHPAGQAAMGEFLAEVATAGVQVIMETHSDHVLNGILRAVKKGLMSADRAALHFFRPRWHSEQGRLPQVHSPLLDSEGNVDSWPHGFFDQFDKDMNYLAGWS